MKRSSRHDVSFFFTGMQEQTGECIMKRWGILLIVGICLLIGTAYADESYNWYEIFVRSYQDSDGDGIGDIRGVQMHLADIADMGYTGLWLMPVMPSPSYHKYDVTDYMQIDPEYGTLEDMQALIAQAHARGIRVILDLPINHTSVQHPWFQSAMEEIRNGQRGAWTEFYRFTQTPGDGFVPLEDTGWYYEESFSGGGMPDLNLDSPAVKTEITRILTFWLSEMQVDGFRLDAVTSYFTGEPDRNIAFLSWLKETCESIHPDSFLVGECWAGLDTIAQYYESKVDAFFLFPASQAEGFVISSLRGRSAHAEKFIKAYERVLSTLDGCKLAPFLCNHDTGRTLGAVQGRSNLPAAKFAEGILGMMQGYTFTYYGEEIGMVGSGEDPNKRLAMNWNESERTLQPPGAAQAEYPYPSWDVQKEDPDSLLNYCRKVNQIRLQYPMIALGKNSVASVSGDVCLLSRTWDDSICWIAMNFSQKETLACDVPENVMLCEELLTGAEHVSQTGTVLSLPPYSIAILEKKTEDNPLYVRKISDLPEDFYLGMDVSSCAALEASGVVYYDDEGNRADLFSLLARNGVNLIRLRVWNDPYTEEGKGYGGGNNDVQTAIALGKRATEAGMRVLIDFHYSDFWADPSKQMTPKAWEGMKIREKAAALYDFTRDSLLAMRDSGVDVAMVQLGNETNGKLCGEHTWMNLYKLMNAGSKAVREVFPEALVALHFANPENADSYRTYASKMDYYQLDYDVFGTSYYPYWHGTLDNLASILSEIAQQYGKKVMVMETSYAWTLEDGDGSGNTIGEGGGYAMPYPVSPQGQVIAFEKIAEVMRDIGGIGVCYWEGAWVPVPAGSQSERMDKWEELGSGWAASYAGEYDPNDAGLYYGGCACENQALFDFQAHALPSLAMFRLIREGNQVPLSIVSVQEMSFTADIGETILLPETLPAMMNDGSQRNVRVDWDQSTVVAEDGVRVIHGNAEQLPVTCTVRGTQWNYLKNGSFEDTDVSMWVCEDHKACEELYAEEKTLDSLTGDRHWHFYSSRAQNVDFTLMQTLDDLPEGIYTYSISVMGGDAGEQALNSFVAINGQTVAVQSTEITSWNQWHTPVISGIEVREGDQVTVGIHVKCDGSGAWGKIDDAMLHRTIKD